MENNTEQTPRTPAELKQDTNFWYKIHVLLHDLRNIKTNPDSEKRTLCTTGELYISGPYFTDSEAALIKSALVSLPLPTTDLDFFDEENENENGAAEQNDIVEREVTVEEAIKERLAGFFEKRRASGDSRPCGPHDMAPIYERVFGIEKRELEDERFLGRLRRSGWVIRGRRKGRVVGGRRRRGRRVGERNVPGRSKGPNWEIGHRHVVK